MKPSETSPHRGGRPRREAGPKLPQDEVDRLLVEGEETVRPDGTTTRSWPSQREIAKRFGVAPSLITAFAKHAGCAVRRMAFQATLEGPSPSAADGDVASIASTSDAVARIEPSQKAASPAPVPSSGPSRKPGRPRKPDAPLISHEELDRLLVFGEAELLDSGVTTTVYPSYRQLAARYGVVVSVIADYAKHHNCMRRRKQAATRVAIRTEEKLIDMRAEAIAVGEDRLVQMIDNFLLSFEAALAEGRVRSDNPTDVNTLARLKAFILGGADSRQEVRAMLSLENLQERYARAQRDRRDVTPEMAGVNEARAPSLEEVERTPEQAPST